MKPDQANPRTTIVIFILFFCSGFSSLIYQVVWLRMAFAHFGIITPVLSVVVSVFMLGLGVGSLVAGRWGAPCAARLGISPSVLYGAAELMIGLGAFIVPMLFLAGDTALISVGSASSGWYLLLSALVISGAILPSCILMGTTFPLMMAYVRALGDKQRDSFSYLYLANVIGAMCGTLVSALVLIELFGFRATSLIAACVNCGIALVAFLLPRASEGVIGRPTAELTATRETNLAADRWWLIILFTTGFCSLAMEVLWTRAYTIVLATTIYAFAAILATYLFATWLGSAYYRVILRRGIQLSNNMLLAAAAGTALLPVVINDPRLHYAVSRIFSFIPLPWPILMVLSSIIPFCAVLGFLTPKLVDDYSRGDPRRAGWCYAINILGGIIGPLVAGYLIVPLFDMRFSLLAFALPIVYLAIVPVLRGTVSGGGSWKPILPTLLLLGVATLFGTSYEASIFGSLPRKILRDHVATVVAGGEGMTRALLVNGVGMTGLTPITKVMAHLTLTAHGKAKDVLVVCFGMGTTLRSMRSWGVDVTAVDLVPSVPAVFSFFHDDTAAVIADPRVHIVIDDGRRFLLRTERMFDVIVIDPPPPVEAAGSSLLYSTAFYVTAKRRLRPDGILQQWVPRDSEPQITQSIARALTAEFPYVMAFNGVDRWGVHFLASMRPIPPLSVETFLATMPEAAQRDLIEWAPGSTPAAMMATILAGARPMSDIIRPSDSVPPITDNAPFNEYFFLRRHVMGSAQ
jgi:spermidine synthase